MKKKKEIQVYKLIKFFLKSIKKTWTTT